MCSYRNSHRHRPKVTYCHKIAVSERAYVCSKWNGFHRITFEDSCNDLCIYVKLEVYIFVSRVSTAEISECRVMFCYWL